LLLWETGSAAFLAAQQFFNLAGLRRSPVLRAPRSMVGADGEPCMVVVWAQMSGTFRLRLALFKATRCV